MLKLENIVAGYGHITALKDISLEVPQGSIVSLIGANGAGKSTTMKTIMGLVKPTSGKVLLGLSLVWARIFRRPSWARGTTAIGAKAVNCVSPANKELIAAGDEG